MREPSLQPSLFSAAAPAERLRHVYVDAARLAVGLPRGVHFGTAGWVHPEWVGEVWPRVSHRDELMVHGLVQYETHPLLSSVLWEVPPTSVELVRDARIIAAAPPRLKVFAQVPLQFTRPRSRAPSRVNPSFLDGRALRRDVILGLFETLGQRLAGLWLTFPPDLTRAGLTGASFAARLDLALESCQSPVPVLVEVNERGMLTLELDRVLAKHGAAHVMSTAPGMPPLREQLHATPSGPLRVVRAIGRPEVSEVAAVMQPVPGQEAYVIVEAHVPAGAPGFIRAVAAELAGRGASGQVGSRA